MNSWEKASASCAAQAETKRLGTAASSAMSSAGIFGGLDADVLVVMLLLTSRRITGSPKGKLGQQPGTNVFF
jgi:hypothetical protein